MYTQKTNYTWFTLWAAIMYVTSVTHDRSIERLQGANQANDGY